MKFIAVIGNGKSGKSTIVSSLTGCRVSSFKGFVEDQGTGHSIFVCSGSPQEEMGTLISNITTWMDECKAKKACNGMVMSIQPTIPTKRVSMEQIFEKAIGHGFQTYAFVVEPGYRVRNNGCHADVLSRLERTGVPASNVLKIDGRRFALNSASYIESVTAILANSKGVR